MAKAVQLSQLRLDARLYADERPGGADAYITDDELDRLINLELDGLYDLLVQAGGHELYRSSATITTAAGTPSYALPADYYQTQEVTVHWSAHQQEDVPDMHRRDMAGLNTWGSWGSHTPKGYRVEGTSLVLAPTPTSAVTVVVGYVPVRADLVDGTDTFDGVNGWEKLVALRVAAQMREIQEQSSGDLEERARREEARVEQMAESRSQYAAKAIFDEGPAYPFVGSRMFGRY